MQEHRELLQLFAKSARTLLGGHLKKILVFGSYARGDYHEGSDIDIMILTSLPDKENEAFSDELYGIAFDYEIDYGIVINPILKNEEHFNYWLGALPFYNNVLKDGVEIG